MRSMRTPKGGQCEWAVGAARRSLGTLSVGWVSGREVFRQEHTAGRGGPLACPHNHRGRRPIHTGHVGPHMHCVLRIWLQSVELSRHGLPRNQLGFLWAWEWGRRQLPG